MKKWKLISQGKPIQVGYRRLIPREYELPNGTRGEWHVKDEAESAAVVALTALREVVLVRQFRAGPNQLLLELPGGNMEDREHRTETARRELREETGYDGDVEYVGPSFDCAYSTRVKHCFVAANCVKRGEPMTESTEDVEVVLMPLNDFREHVRSGALTDGWIAYRALDYLGLLGETEAP
jgi:ADP-ribose diphosphatase